jgi:polyferredoxin
VIGYGRLLLVQRPRVVRFFCPLAAMMHLYARVGRFRILADKKKCISCNVCTSVCHQGSTS